MYIGSFNVCFFVGVVLTMKIEQAIKENQEAILAGNYAFAECCLKVAIKQAKEFEEKQKPQKGKS